MGNKTFFKKKQKIQKIPIFFFPTPRFLLMGKLKFFAGCFGVLGGFSQPQPLLSSKLGADSIFFTILIPLYSFFGFFPQAFWPIYPSKGKVNRDSPEQGDPIPRLPQCPTPNGTSIGISKDSERDI